MARRVRSGLDGRKSRRAGGIRARRMTEPGFAVARAAVRGWRDVENDVVRARGIAVDSTNRRPRAGGGHVIETDKISHAPGNVEVRTASVTAAAHAADKLMAVIIEDKGATKDDDAK